MVNSSAVNIIPLSMVRKLQKSLKDLIHTKVSITSFIGQVKKSLGLLPIDLIVGTQSTLIAFFVVESSSSYNALLGKD